MSFQGYVTLGETFVGAVLIRDSVRTPVNPDAAPSVRIYGPDGLVADATTAATKLDSGTITGATNATPIVVTSANHGLTTGTYITVSGAVGNTGANGTFTMTKLTADTFELDGSAGNGAWTSGGAWNVAGLYTYSVSVAGGDGFEAGSTYQALVQFAVASVASAEVQEFIVV